LHFSDGKDANKQLAAESHIEGSRSVGKSAGRPLQQKEISEEGNLLQTTGYELGIVSSRVALSYDLLRLSLWFFDLSIYNSNVIYPKNGFHRGAIACGLGVFRRAAVHRGAVSCGLGVFSTLL
jgi:hypothetical protein